MVESTYKFCPDCGYGLHLRLQGDWERLTGTLCDSILYRNPAVGLVLVQARQVLLGRTLAASIKATGASHAATLSVVRMCATRPSESCWKRWVRRWK